MLFKYFQKRGCRLAIAGLFNTEEKQTTGIVVANTKTAFQNKKKKIGHGLVVTNELLQMRKTDSRSCC
jgi:hypothetical protein